MRLINAHQIAAKFGGQVAKTFFNKRARLEWPGFPLPLNLPGQNLWDEAEVDAWLASRRRPNSLPPAATANEPTKRRPGHPRKIEV